MEAGIVAAGGTPPCSSRGLIEGCSFPSKELLAAGNLLSRACWAACAPVLRLQGSTCLAGAKSSYWLDQAGPTAELASSKLLIAFHCLVLANPPVHSELSGYKIVLNRHTSWLPSNGSMMPVAGRFHELANVVGQQGSSTLVRVVPVSRRVMMVK